MKVIQFTEKEFDLIFENTLKSLVLELDATKNWCPDDISDPIAIDSINHQVNNTIKEMHRRFHYQISVLKNRLTD
jgi:hypothetical protein